MITKLAAIATCCVAAVTANAADNGLYMGVGVGQSKFDVQNAIKRTDTGYKMIAGVRLLDSFGLEVNYADHGKASIPSGVACIALVGVNCPGVSNIKATTISGFAVGFLDFPVLDLFAKAGLASASGKLHTPGLPTFGGSDTRTDFAWGAGVQAHFLSLGARAEFEQFKVFGGQKLNMTSVSFIYTLL